MIGKFQIFLARIGLSALAPHRLPARDDLGANKIGDVADVLIDKEGNVTAMIIAVGGFLSMGEKDVAVPFSSIRSSEKNNKSYLVLNTTKEALKSAPGFTYDKTRTAWVPAAK